MDSITTKKPFVFIDMIKKPKIKNRHTPKPRSTKPVTYDSKNVIQYKRTTKQMKPTDKNANSNLLNIMDKQLKTAYPYYYVATSELIKNSDGDTSFIKLEYQALYPDNNDIDRKIREAMSNMLKQGYFEEFERKGKVTRKPATEWDFGKKKRLLEKKKPKETKYLSEIAFNKWVKEENPSDSEIQDKLDDELWFKIDDNDVTYNKWLNNGELVTVNKYPIF